MEAAEAGAAPATKAMVAAEMGEAAAAAMAAAATAAAAAAVVMAAAATATATERRSRTVCSPVQSRCHTKRYLRRSTAPTAPQRSHICQSSGRTVQQAGVWTVAVAVMGLAATAAAVTAVAVMAVGATAGAAAAMAAAASAAARSLHDETWRGTQFARCAT